MMEAIEILAILPFLPAIGKGLAAIAGPLTSALTSRANVRDTNRANRNLAEYSYNRDLEMWNRQNQYNSPEAQMERLRKAGLNPKMIYNSGSAAATGMAKEMPKYNAPTMDYSGRLPVSIPQMIAEFQDVNLKQAQIDNVKAQTEIKDLEQFFLDKTMGARLTTERSKSLKESYEYQKAGKDVAIKDLMIDRMEKELTQKDLDNIYKKYRNQWAEQGITSSDNIGLRMTVRMLQNAGIDLTSLIQN